MSKEALRPGDLVEIRSAAEILATLDENGALDGMPFMPEMVPLCGQRFKVDRRVERVCDTLNRAQWSVQLSNTLYLDGLRCDGSAHGGCQATCRLFWNEAWLKPVNEDTVPRNTEDRRAELLARVSAVTSNANDPDATELRYSCQATQLPAFSERISASDPRQYVREYTSGNVGLRTFATVMARAAVMQPLHKMGKLPNPPVHGTTTKSPPTEALNLEPGEWVRVKTRDEIADTLTVRGMNRGLWFDREMLPFCDGVFRVERRITQIIDEATGKMIALGNDCVVLENAFCSGLRSVGRWFCPRETPPYWRECWLKRVSPADAPAQSVEIDPAQTTVDDGARVEPDTVAVSTDVGDEIYRLVRELYPVCRSITGDGVRETLSILGHHLPMVITELASATPVLDWTVPNEWNIRDAFIADSSGNRLVDFRKSNLHVVSYSTPVNTRMSLEELRPHLHTIPDRPDTIPYRTSYYNETWGFCLTQRQLDAMPEGEYEVVIDATLEPGSLTFGEVLVPGSTTDEVLISAHVCHPSLCDDNLSGISIAATLARQLLDGPTPRHTFRFVFAPATIGAIAWLHSHRDSVDSIKHGLTLTCLGDDRHFTYKRSVLGNAVVDRAAALTLAACGDDNDVIDFFPYGYDERQYGSPGFRLPVGSLMRSRHGTFPEYHTSDDNLDFVSAPRLAESLAVLRKIIDVIDRDRTMLNLAPWGEPQLGRRGLYRAVGGKNIPDLEFAMLWVLNQSDGQTSLLDIAERGGVDHSLLVTAAELLEQHQLLQEVVSQ